MHEFIVVCELYNLLRAMRRGGGRKGGGCCYGEPRPMELNMSAMAVASGILVAVAVAVVGPLSVVSCRVSIEIAEVGASGA